MNYKKGIFINLILVLLSGVILFFLYRPAPVKDEVPLKTEEIQLLNYNVADVAAVALIHDDVRFGLIHKDGNISLQPSAEDPLPSQELMQSYLYSVSKLTALSRIEYPEDESPNFGLDNPRSRMTLILKDGNKVRLFLGSQSPLKDAWYCKAEDGEDIYLLSDETARLFLAEPQDFVSKSILPRVDLKELNSLERLTLSFRGNDPPSYSVENRGDFIFRLVSPVETSIDYESVLSSLIFPILSLNPEEWIDGEVDLPDTSDLLLDAVIDGKSYRISFYKADEDGYFLQSRGTEGIFRISEEALPFLHVHYLDLMNDSIYHSNVSEIREIIVSDRENQKDYNIRVTGDSVQIQGDINGFKAGYSEMMTLFDVLLNTGLARELDSLRELSVDAPVSFSVQIYKKNGSIDQLDFLDLMGKEGEQILFVNGKAAFSTYYKTVLEIRNTLEKLVQKDGE